MALTKLRLLWIDGEKRSGKIFLLFCGCRKWITLEWIYYKNPKNSFCAAFCPKTPVQGFYYNSILGLYSYYFKFIKKIRKDPCIHFFETCKTSIWAYFVLQTSKQFFRVNFKTLYYYNFIQKKTEEGFGLKSSIQDFSKKGHSGQLWAYMVLQFIAKNEKNCEFQFFLSLEKPHFGFILIDSFWLENTKTRFLSKKITQVIFKTLRWCTWMQRIRKIAHVHFSKDFILSSFGQKIQDFFENNLAKIQKITTSVSGEKLLKTGKRTESIS